MTKRLLSFLALMILSFVYAPHAFAALCTSGSSANCTGLSTGSTCLGTSDGTCSLYSPDQSGKCYCAIPEYRSGSFCIFTPAGASTGNITIGNACVIYEDINGVANGNLVVNANITLNHDLVFYPGYKITILGGKIFVNSTAKIKQGKICLKMGANGYPMAKTVTGNIESGSNAGIITSSALIQLDSVIATFTPATGLYTCPANYALRETFPSLAYIDTGSSNLGTSDADLLSMGFIINGVSSLLAPAGDIIFSDRNLKINQGRNIYFPHSSQSDTNDGKINAAVFGTGLNIVGIKTDTTYRKLSLWGEITQQQNGGKNTWAGTNYFANSVGIGNANPTATLDVTGNIWTTTAGSGRSSFYDLGGNKVSAASSIYSYGSICTGNWSGNCDSNAGVVIGPTNTNATVNITNNSTSFFNGGNVGIGTTAPTQKLHVTNSAVPNNFLVTAGNGLGVCFWADCTNYKVSMGNTGEYFYGPVSDYSIKYTMGNGATRGWTWGGREVAPIMGVSLGTGDLKTAGSVYSGSLRSYGTMFANNAFFTGSVGVGGITSPHGKLNIQNPGYNVDGIVIHPQLYGDNTNGIQTYINDAIPEGGWGDWGYAGGCCNSLYIQPYAGDLTLGNARGVAFQGPTTINGTVKSSTVKHVVARPNVHTTAGTDINWATQTDIVGAWGFGNGFRYIYPPENGTYMINVNVEGKTTPGCTRYRWQLRKSNVNLASSDADHGPGQYATTSLTVVTDLTTSQFINVWMDWALGDGTCYIWGSGTISTSISITKLN